MPWFKVDDGFHSHPKTMRAGTAAAGLWVRCGSYCAQHLTDGFVPEEVAAAYGTRQQIKALVDAGLWLTADGGWRMHDFLERNPSRVEVEADRAAAAARQRKAREASKSRRDSQRDYDGTSGKVTVPPTRPDPTRPGSWSDFEEEVEVELHESERHFEEQDAAEVRRTLRAVVADWPEVDGDELARLAAEDVA